MLLTASFVFYFFMALLIDAKAAPRGRFSGRPLWGHLTAVLALTLLYAFWFAISWRPVFAATASLITYAIVMLISDYKFRNVQEPLNFVDFALIPQILRHPVLYQAAFLRHPLFFAGIAALLGVILLWWGFAEISLLSDGRLWSWALPGSLFVIGAIAWLVAGPLPEVLVAAVHRRMMPADSARHVREIGLAASLLAGLIGWRHALPGARTWPATEPATESDNPDRRPLVIAVQSESFVDLKRAGFRDIDLPGLKDARARSVAHGLVKVPVQGAWTLRSEFAFIAGRSLETFGLESLHPYLRLRSPPRTIAHHLAGIGFSTVFVHPFDLDFFNRRQALPKLGFDRLLGVEDFAGVTPDGYYIPDMALAERVLEMAAAEPRPLFCMIATMENHNPWDDGRVPGITGTVDLYMHHLRNADRMIARLVDGIERLGRPAVLAFYGDHVPTMPELADPFPDPRTDYFVMGFHNGAWLAGEPRDCALHDLADMVLDTLDRVRDVPR